RVRSGDVRSVPTRRSSDLGLPHLLAGRKSRLESRLATHARRLPGRDVGQPIGAETYPATHAACVCRAAFHPGGLASPILLAPLEDRKSTRLNSSHQISSYA